MLLIIFGSLFQKLHLWSGLIVTELVLVVGPPLLYTWRYRYPIKSTFLIAPISIRTLILSILSALLAFVLVGGIAAFQEAILPRSHDYQEVWEKVLQ